MKKMAKNLDQVNHLLEILYRRFADPYASQKGTESLKKTIQTLLAQ